MSSDDTYTRENRLAEEAFPEDWNEDDVEFLAQFLAENFDAELVRVVSDDDYDYDLYKRKNTTSSSKMSSSSSDIDLSGLGYNPALGDSLSGRADGGWGGRMDRAQRRVDE